MQILGQHEDIVELEARRQAGHVSLVSPEGIRQLVVHPVTLVPESIFHQQLGRIGTLNTCRAQPANNRLVGKGLERSAGIVDPLRFDLRV